jgi:hypothetical protein
MDTKTPAMKNPLESTARLLTDESWRIRLIEKVLPLSVDHYELRRSYQFRMPIDEFADLVDESGLVDVFLPICWLPKHPLLEFDISDASGTPMPVLERVSNAGAAAEILDAWLERIDEPRPDQTVTALLEDMCYRSLAPWRLASDRRKSKDNVVILHQYYIDLLDVNLAPSACQELLSTANEAVEALLQALSIPVIDDLAINTTLNPAILAPFTRRIENRGGLKEEVERLCGVVRSIAAAAVVSEEAAGWAALLYRATTHWPVLVRMDVKPGSEHIIKTREVRPSGDNKASVTVHEADLGGATSYHLEVRVPEPAVKLHKPPSITDLSGAELGAPGAFDSAKWSGELFTAYSTSIDRPGRPDVARVRIKYSLYLTTVLPDLFALVLVAISLAAALVYRDVMNTGLAAVLLIPTTVVSGFLAIRESTLVARMLRPLRLLEPLANVVLWLVVLSLINMTPAGG